MVVKLDIFLRTSLTGSTNLIPGIGKVCQNNLKESKIDKIFHIILIFLIFDKDEELFLNWFKKYQSNSRYRLFCYNALNLWCDKHF